jgi:hypothetical protein
VKRIECGNCKTWLGESVVDLVFVEHVEKGVESVSELGVRPPRDLRLCKSCDRVNVFIPRAELDQRRAAVIP